MKETKVCKHCKKKIDKRVKICPYCLKIQSNSIIKGICLFLLVIIIIGSISFTSNDNTSSNKKNSSSTLKETENSYSTNKVKESELEANSNEKLNYLVKKGQSKAKNANIKEADEALSYIKNNIDNPFSNNSIMENLIYYGTVLEYYYANNDSSFNGFSDIRGKIGMNTVQAIKYVYRNIETPTNDATISNINKVKEDLLKIN